ncbi:MULTISPECIES: M48 family metallopeptidase [unclassified Rhizobium]|uniref:M48 family metallopeptidase n=1 Tax=unclassified Rhizobium TaxID=2613769 RepID=UPI001617E134|nr:MULTISPECIES: M48 family metallopeptidase [unclassified Rhizobium]MBB3383181.1 Zn-dependent protease with chaperone function [Rhizobium sp. BK098]MBB3614881.1 Zn-dependent protease with chaperone function [Rhizobium sp. BK609]MBB3679731.1 Zn-dependent protease with chaperone function [Rhizobium sp. BK612]
MSMDSTLASDPQTIATGVWHPPHSSREVPSRLMDIGGSLMVLSSEEDEEDKRLAWGIRSDIEVSPRVGSIPRRIVFGNESVFETCDNDAVDAYLRSRGEGRSGFVHGLEIVRPRLIAFALATIVLASVIYRYALPILVEVAVLVTPPVVPEMMSAGTLKALDQVSFGPSKLPAAQQTEIRNDFDTIAANAEGGAGRYHLNFRDGGLIGPNAFALPDGNLVLTDQLVELAGGDKELIAAVLGHEIGHVEYRHSLRQLYRAAGVAGLVLLIAGDVGSGIQDLLTQGGGLLALSYSREAEAQADRRSVELMQAAGMDPTALSRFFDILETKLGDHSSTSMLSTHPGTPERKQAILGYARELEEKGTKPKG